MFPSTTDVRDEAVRHLLVEEARLDANEVAGEERQGGEAFFTAGRRKVKPVLALGSSWKRLWGMLVKMGVQEKKTDGGRRLL